MTRFFLKYKFEIIIVLLLTGIFFLLRVSNLTLQPIFADEAIYIRWAQVMKAEPTLRFLPLSDGKTPLFMWAMAPFLKIFTDPLLAGRFLSVLAGYFTFLGILFLGWKNFSSRVGLWSALLLAITPFIVFFDRMALVDSMLAAFSIWSLNLALLLIKYERIDLAMVLGYTLGGGLLTKTPGMFNILSLPFTWVTFNWLSKTRQFKVIKLFVLFLLSVGTAFIIYNALRLGPGFDNLSSRNQDYIFSPFDLIGRPLDPFIPHLRDLADWFPKLFTIPILFFVFIGAILAFLKKNKVALSILAWSLFPLIIETALLKTFTARYLLMSIAPLLCLSAWAIDAIINKVKFKKDLSVLVVLILISPLALYFNFKLITDPANAPLPKEERMGYLEDWTAGYGLKDIAQFLINEAKNGSIVVGTEGSFGTLPDGLQIYLDRHSHSAPPTNQISVIGGPGEVSLQLRQAALKHPTFFVANRSRFSEFVAGLVLLKEYPKASGGIIKPTDSILLFKVLPEAQK